MSLAALKEKVNSGSLKSLKSFGTPPNGAYVSTIVKRLPDDEREGTRQDGTEWFSWETPVIVQLNEPAEYSAPDEDEWTDFEEMFGSNHELKVSINRDPQWSLVHDQLISAVDGDLEGTFEEALDEAITEKTQVVMVVRDSGKTRNDGTPIVNYYFNELKSD